MNKFVKIIASGTIFFASTAVAQDIEWKLVDTGVLKHSVHGNGIEMRIQPIPFLDGLFGHENLDFVVLTLCNHYAPDVIPFVQKQIDIDNPDFIAVRLVSGGTMGIYALQAFTIVNGRCGDAL